MTQQFLTDLEHRLHDLADTASPPDLDAAADVERGRRRLARRRAAVGAVALATAAVVTVGAIGVTAGSDGADPAPADGPAPTTATDPVSPSPTIDPPPPLTDRRNGKQLLTDWAKALARHLDPQGGHLETKVTGYQGGGGLGTKLGWSVPGEDGLGMVQVFVGPGAFSGGFGPTCDRFSPPCEEVTVGGVQMRVQRIGDTTAVYHVQDDGDRVWLYLDPLFGNNSLVPVSRLDFPLRTLAAAVSDPAFVTPTQRQVNGTSESFGWPDPGMPGVPGVSPPPG